MNLTQNLKQHLRKQEIETNGGELPLAYAR